MCQWMVAGDRSSGGWLWSSLAGGGQFCMVVVLFINKSERVEGLT